MDDRPPPNGDQDDELTYEDFDDPSAWTDPDDLPAIDLDALDDAIEPEDEPNPDTRHMLDALDDAIDEHSDKAEAENEEDEDTKHKTGDATPGAQPPPPTETPDEEQVAALDDAIAPEDEPDADTAAALAALDTLDDDLDEASAGDTPPQAATGTEQPLATPEEGAAEETAETEEAEAEAPKPTSTPPDDARKTATPPAAPSPAGERPALETVYQVLIPLPPDLADQVTQLRTTATLSDNPPPGVEFAVAFRTAKLDEVQAVLRQWARAHLPFQLEITGVEADVIDNQQYVAAWTLQPDEELHDANRALVRALAPLIRPVEGARVRSRVRVLIGDDLPPGPYPRVVGQMQRQFQPYVWHAEAVTLVSTRPDADWATVESFR